MNDQDSLSPSTLHEPPGNPDIENWNGEVPQRNAEGRDVIPESSTDNNSQDVNHPVSDDDDDDNSDERPDDVANNANTANVRLSSDGQNVANEVASSSSQADYDVDYDEVVLVNEDSVSNDVAASQDETAAVSTSTQDDNSNLPVVVLERCRGKRKSHSSYCGTPAKVRKDFEDNDGETCPICLDSWGNSGDHRLVALKCGHLFGSNCVERWLKALPAKARSCPTCKSKATLKDLRYIFARKLVASDTSEITTLQEQINTVKAEKNKVELELEKSKIAHRACLLQLDVLRKTLLKSQTVKEPVRKQWRFALEKNLEVCRDRGCRVLTYNCRTYELYVTQKGSNYLFPGYGVRIFSCLDYTLGSFTHLHTKPIRDMTYSQPRDLLLTVGLDNTARIVERGIPSLAINTGMQLWCCSWDYLRTNEFYVGGVGGVIHQYDFRNPSSYLQVLRNSTDATPVASLSSTEYGLMSCQLKSAWLWVANQRQWEPRSLPVDGPFMSLCYDQESHRVLVSTRPNASSQARAKLTLCKLKTDVQGEVIVDIEDTFSGTSRASIMSRAAWVKAPGASWVASHSESDAALFLHGLDGTRTMSLPAAEPAVDVHSVHLNGNTLLAALSESRLRLYKAVQTS